MTYYDMKILMQNNKINITGAVLNCEKNRLKRIKVKLLKTQLESLRLRYGYCEKLYRNSSINDLIFQNENGRYTVLFRCWTNEEYPVQTLVVRDNNNNKNFLCDGRYWCWLFSRDSFTNAIVCRNINYGIIIPDENTQYIEGHLYEIPLIKQAVENLDLELKHILDLGKALVTSKILGIEQCKLNIKVINGSKAENERIDKLVNVVNSLFYYRAPFNLLSLALLNGAKIKISENMLYQASICGSMLVNQQLDIIDKNKFKIKQENKIKSTNSSFLGASLNESDILKFIEDGLHNTYRVLVLYPDKAYITEFDMYNRIKSYGKNALSETYGTVFSNELNELIKELYVNIACQFATSAIFNISWRYFIDKIYKRTSILIHKNTLKNLDICNICVNCIDDKNTILKERIDINNYRYNNYDIYLGEYAIDLFLGTQLCMNTYKDEDYLTRGYTDISVSDIRKLLGFSREIPNNPKDDVRNIDTNMIINSALMRNLFGEIPKNDLESLQENLNIALNKIADNLDI